MASHIYKCPGCGVQERYYGVGVGDVPSSCLKGCGYEGKLDIVWENFPFSVKTSCKSGSNERIDGEGGLPTVVGVEVLVSSRLISL